jgi:hypothetical protein
LYFIEFKIQQSFESVILNVKDNFWNMRIYKKKNSTKFEVQLCNLKNVRNKLKSIKYWGANFEKLVENSESFSYSIFYSILKWT